MELLFKFKDEFKYLGVLFTSEGNLEHDRSSSNAVVVPARRGEKRA